jgi:hypothetical protein
LTGNQRTYELEETISWIRKEKIDKRKKMKEENISKFGDFEWASRDVHCSGHRIELGQQGRRLPACGESWA